MHECNFVPMSMLSKILAFVLRQHVACKTTYKRSMSLAAPCAINMQLQSQRATYGGEFGVARCAHELGGLQYGHTRRKLQRVGLWQRRGGVRGVCTDAQERTPLLQFLLFLAYTGDIGCCQGFSLANRSRVIMFTQWSALFLIYR